jgi:hypothetical protein
METYGVTVNLNTHALMFGKETVAMYSVTIDMDKIKVVSQEINMPHYQP